MDTNISTRYKELEGTLTPETKGLFNDILKRLSLSDNLIDELVVLLDDVNQENEELKSTYNRLHGAYFRLLERS